MTAALAKPKRTIAQRLRASVRRVRHSVAVAFTAIRSAWDGLRTRSITPALGTSSIGARIVRMLARGAGGDAYTGSGWVYSCVSANASTLAQVPWLVEVRRGKEWVRVEGDEHPLAALVEAPNDLDSWEDLIEQTSLALDLAGNSILTKIRRKTGDKAPLEIHWFNPETWTPKGSETQVIDHYLYRTPRGSEVRVEPEDVIHVRLPVWDDARWGVAPLTAARRKAAIDEAGDAAMEALNERGFRPRVHIHFEGASPDEIETWRAIIEESYMTPDAEGRPFITGGPKSSVDSLTISAKDAQYVQQKQLTRTEIAAIFVTPEPVVGILDKANYNNMRAAVDLWWRRCLVPRLRRIQRTLKRQLVLRDYGRDVRLRFDEDAIPTMVTDIAERLANAGELFALGYTTDEINARLGLGMPDIGDRAVAATVTNLAAARAARKKAKKQAETERAAA